MAALKSQTTITLYRGFHGTGAYVWSPYVTKLEAPRNHDRHGEQARLVEAHPMRQWHHVRSRDKHALLECAVVRSASLVNTGREGSDTGTLVGKHQRPQKSPRR
ncbi:hypothetical protein V1517DRAFT_329130 [Lipomyces orientalis]|uniref:Uncharacterized protein n=1 Tax=Lipomyces orientalis TaxID=1233043 RepID=A0ACC3THA4_9ASCO